MYIVLIELGLCPTLLATGTGGLTGRLLVGRKHLDRNAVGGERFAIDLDGSGRQGESALLGG